jgi:hypothetical protein
MNLKPLFLFGLCSLFLWSCAPSRFVEPLDKGELSVGAQLGGPVIDFGGPVPMPISSLEVGYGLDTNLTVHGALHTTAAIFGNFQLDAGVTYQFLAQKNMRPNLSVNPGFNFITDLYDDAVNFWPTLDLNAFWNYGKRDSYFYVGINNYFELSKTQALDQPQDSYWLFNPQIGHVWKTNNDVWQITSEIKFLAPNYDNSYAFIPYQSILGTRGATGFYLGVRYKFANK